jgi:hypothetical protein
MPLTVVDQGLLSSTAQYTGFKNRIINGAMVIDQRNAGASVSVTSSQYCLDRWNAAILGGGTGRYSVQRSTTVPSSATFINSQIVTVTTADASPSAIYGYSVYQPIEGFNISDLGWGTANAQTVTLSFWVRSSVTGTYGVTLGNDAGTAQYCATYTISSANTFEYKTITVAGPTSGTFNTGNTSGVVVGFGLGGGSSRTASSNNAWISPAGGYLLSQASGGINLMATNGATFYITGVQLEKGSTATSFDYRPYGTELALCQRYCQVFGSGAGAYENFGMGMTTSTTNSNVFFPLVVSMRTQPTLTTTGSFRVADFVNYSTSATLGINTDYSGVTAVTFACTSSGLTSQRFAFLQASNDTTARVKLSAEL